MVAMKATLCGGFNQEALLNGWLPELHNRGVMVARKQGIYILYHGKTAVAGRFRGIKTARSRAHRWLSARPLAKSLTIKRQSGDKYVYVEKVKQFSK